MDKEHRQSPVFHDELDKYILCRREDVTLKCLLSLSLSPSKLITTGTILRLIAEVLLHNFLDIFKSAVDELFELDLQVFDAINLKRSLVLCKRSNVKTTRGWSMRSAHN